MIKRLLPPGYRTLPSEFWVIVGAIFLSFIGLGVVLPVRILYAQQVGLSLTEIGVMGSAFFFTQFFSQVPIGSLSDRLGRKWTLLGGLLIQGLAAGVYLISDQPWVFIGMRGIEGIGAAAQQPAARAYIADVVPEQQRGRAYGVYRAAFQGGLLAGPALGGLLAGLGGFEIAYILNGATRLLSCLAVLIWVHERTRPAARVSAGSRASPVARSRAQETPTLRRLFTPPLCAAYVVALGALAAHGLDSSIWSIYLSDLGASLTLIGLTYTVRAGAAVLLGPIGGSLADRFDRPLIIAWVGVLLTATSVALAFVRDLGLITLVALAQGAAMALIGPALDRYLADHSPVWGRARVQSIFQAVQSGSGGLMSLAAGPLYEREASWPFLAVAGLNLLAVCGGGLLMLSTDRAHQRQSKIETAARLTRVADR